ncbi:uncharacterized protein LOC120182393 [Hibiscus syriacus]|uniref:uncharacterized protein LOC120182393 n=1 Tax=Hibiscus syriacus TaxID=106335 RepID=UPI001924F0B5|nr:uncharacterized protein LOC120182393 [Hibiscus syriacus]
MTKAQNDMMKNLASLMQGNSIIREETPVIGHIAEECVYPLGFELGANGGKASVIWYFRVNILSPWLHTTASLRTTSKDCSTGKAGEMIEMAIISGKLDRGESSRKPPARMKDNEISNVKKYDSNNITVSQPQATGSSTQNPVKQGANEPRQERERVQFDPIPMTYKELFQILYDKHVVSPYHTSPIEPPYPKWYDVNAQCEYHAGISGHTIENYLVFKKLVQRLKQRNVINFGDSEQPNVAQNKLPNYAGTGVNVVIEEKVNGVITEIDEVKSPMDWIWGQMVKVGWLISNVNKNEHACPCHCYEDHIIQDCDEFKALVQGLMDSKDMEFYHEATKEREIEVYASEGTSKGVYNANCPLVITPKARTMEKVVPKVVITPPSSFPYKDNKQVPWKYECHLENGKNSEATKEETSEPEKRAASDKGKSVEILLKDDEPTVNEHVTENETIEFLKLLKHIEYSIVEQLHKLPARISILALLLSSEAHRSTLLKVLNQTFVPKDVPVENIDRLVANIQADNFLSFSNDEIPSGIMGNSKALHITVRCKGHVLSRVLIDNGSALNVRPLVTLKKLTIDCMHMKNCQNIVRAFDRTKKEVLGKTDIPFTIGPSIYEVEFLVMDIMPTYNYLLGRPWIHQAGVVPSTLHQKIKFVMEGRLVCFNVE